MTDGVVRVVELAGPAGTVQIMASEGVADIDPSALRAARKAASLTQAALADAAGVDPGVYGQYEQGRRRPRVHALYRIARALQVDVLALLRPGIPVSLEILRVRTGRTQEELAAALGMTRAAWGETERGERPVHPDDADRIAAALEVDVAQVLAAERGESITEVITLTAEQVAALDADRPPGRSRAQHILAKLGFPPDDD